MTAVHFDGIQGDHLHRTRVWRSPECGSLWLDDAPESAGNAECGCSECGGSEMEMVGWVSAEDVVRLASDNKEANDG